MFISRHTRRQIGAVRREVDFFCILVGANDIQMHFNDKNRCRVQEKPAQSVPAASSDLQTQEPNHTKSAESTKTPSKSPRSSKRARRSSLKAQENAETLITGNNVGKLDLSALKQACKAYSNDDQSLRTYLHSNNFPERLVKSHIYQMSSNELISFLDNSGIFKKMQKVMKDELDDVRSVQTHLNVFEQLRIGALKLAPLIGSFREKCPLFSRVLDIIAARNPRSSVGESRLPELPNTEYFVLFQLIQNIISQTYGDLQRFISLWGLCNGWSRETFSLLNNLHVSLSLNTALRELCRFNQDSVWRRDFFDRIRRDTPEGQSVTVIMPVLDNTDMHYSRASQRMHKKNSGDVHVTTLSFVKVVKSIPSAEKLREIYPGRKARYDLGYCPQQWENIMPTLHDRRRVDIDLASAIVEKILLSHKDLSGVNSDLKNSYPSPPEERNEFVVGCILPENQSRPSEMIQILKFIGSLGSSAPLGVKLEKILHVDQGGAAVARTSILANEKQGRLDGHDPEDYLDDWIPVAADGHLLLNFLPMLFEMGYTLPAGLGEALEAIQRKNVTRLYYVAPPPIVFETPAPANHVAANSIKDARVTRSQSRSQRTDDDAVLVEGADGPGKDFEWQHFEADSDMDDNDVADQVFAVDSDSDFDPERTTASTTHKNQPQPTILDFSESQKRKGKFPHDNSQINLDFLRDYTSAAVLSAWQYYIASENLQTELESFSLDQLHQTIKRFLSGFLGDRPDEWEVNPTTAATRQLIRYCLILMTLDDCIHRGADSDIVVIWRRLMFAFKAMNKLHYFEESFRLQCAIAFALDDRQAWLLENCRSVACQQSPWCRSTDFAQENVVKVAKKLILPGTSLFFFSLVDVCNASTTNHTVCSVGAS